MTRSYDPHHLPIEGHTPMDPPWPHQQAMQRAKHEEHLEQVEMLQSMGYSQVQIAKTLGVSRKTVYRLIGECRKMRLIDGAATLTERTDLSLLRLEGLFVKMTRTMNTAPLPKDVIAAAEGALKVQMYIDELQGTKSPDKVVNAAVGEMFDVFISIIAEGNPQQRDYYLQRLRQHLRGTHLGQQIERTLVLNAGEPMGAVVDSDDGETAEHVGSDTDVTDEMMVALEEDQDQDD